LPYYKYNNSIARTVLSSEIVAHCVYMQAFPIDENVGNFVGPQLPHQTSQENATSKRHWFCPSTATWNNWNHCAV